ncbi:MAG: hypothetical protein IT443_00325 [Phycisphaeraceae bacterium]|nr:hypothetical protein [Phycisphaeraceae bacterium]
MPQPEQSPINCRLETSPFSSAVKARGGWTPVVVFLAVLIGCGWDLGRAPLWGTEGHRAITAHQLATGGQNQTWADWLYPQLYGSYQRKPPLHYWILALTEKTLGQGNELVWRLPSVLAAASLGALLAAMSQRWFGSIAGAGMIPGGVPGGVPGAIPGAVAGLAYLGLFALWSQNRSADIDSMHTFAAVAAACCLLEVSWRSSSKRWAWGLAGILFSSAAMLLKGHACLPVLLGAIFGPALVLRSTRGLRQPWPWAMLGLGISLLCLWLLAITRLPQHTQSSGQFGGLSEALQRLIVGNGRQFLQALTLPAVLFAYALPVSLAVPILIFPWPGVWRRLAEDQKQIAGSLLGALGGAMVIGILAGMTNPRYSYVALPLLCPLAGLAAALWRDGLLPKYWPSILRWVSAVTIVALGIGAVVLTALTWKESPHPWAMAAMTGGVSLAGIWTFQRIPARHRQPTPDTTLPPALGGFSLMLVLTAMLFGLQWNQGKARRSAYAAGAVLRQAVGEGTTVSAGIMLRDQPELFFYAHAQPRALGFDLVEPRDLGADQWVILTDREWQACAEPMADRLTLIARLPTRPPGSVLAWYSAAGNGRQNQEK